MDRDSYVTLAAQVRAQLDDIAAIYDRIVDREQVPGAAGLDSVALQLHNLYSAMEVLLETIATTFDNHIGSESGYHMALLRRMRVAVPGVRPAAVMAETATLLDTLRRFRHVVRHAYSAAIDERQLRIVLEDARAVRPLLRRDMEAFLSALDPGSG